jgi:hypothetical protein
MGVPAQPLSSRPGFAAGHPNGIEEDVELARLHHVAEIRANVLFRDSQQFVGVDSLRTDAVVVLGIAGRVEALIAAPRQSTSGSPRRTCGDSDSETERRYRSGERGASPCEHRSPSFPSQGPVEVSARLSAVMLSLSITHGRSANSSAASAALRPP